MPKKEYIAITGLIGASILFTKNEQSFVNDSNCCYKNEIALFQL